MDGGLRVLHASISNEYFRIIFVHLGLLQRISDAPNSLIGSASGDRLQLDRRYRSGAVLLGFEVQGSARFGMSTGSLRRDFVQLTLLKVQNIVFDPWRGQGQARVSSLENF